MGTKTERLEYIRQKLGFNKAQFAEAMGIVPNYYYNILKGSGGSNLRIEHLESLFNRFSVNPAWILTGLGKPFFNSDVETEWVAGNIIPDISNKLKVDDEQLAYFVSSIMRECGLPLLYSDPAYHVLVMFGKRYISKHPDAKPDQWDIPALTEAFAVMIQELQELVSALVSMAPDGIVSIPLEGRIYTFQRPAQPGK